jgi:hypothetical protein
MAKGKKPVKKITITVPKEWKAVDVDVIEDIIRLTLGKGPKFGVGHVFVEAAAETPKPGVAAAAPQGIWDKAC